MLEQVYTLQIPIVNSNLETDTITVREASLLGTLSWW